MARLRYNGLSNSLGASLTSGGTTITFASKLTYAGGDVPTLTGTDIIRLSILDSDGNCAEVVDLTAYTSGATTGTIARGKEDTSGVSHSSGATVIHGVTVDDVADVDDEPSQIDGLVAWYDASAITGLSDTDPVDTWADRTGSYDLTQTSTARPTYNTNLQNGLPGVVFNGSAHYMDSSAAPALTGPACSILIAWNPTASGTNDGIVAFVPSSGNDFNSVDGFVLASDNSNQNNLQLVRSVGANGILVSGVTGDSGMPAVTFAGFGGGVAYIRTHRASANDLFSDTTTISAAKIRIGARQDGGVNGFKAMNVYEILIYDRALAGAERRHATNYLTRKWSIPSDPI